MRVFFDDIRRQSVDATISKDDDESQHMSILAKKQY